jgi:hypothetical protein
MVNTVFAYGAYGEVFLHGLNFPASWHNGSIRSNLMPIIRGKIGMYKIFVDQGFNKVGSI